MKDQDISKAMELMRELLRALPPERGRRLLKEMAPKWKAAVNPDNSTAARYDAAADALNLATQAVFDWVAEDAPRPTSVH